MGGFDCKMPSLSSKKGKTFCLYQVQALLRPPFTFEILLLEVGPLQGARSPFVHHGLVIVPLLDRQTVSHYDQHRMTSLREMNGTTFIGPPTTTAANPHSSAAQVDQRRNIKGSFMLNN